MQNASARKRVQALERRAHHGEKACVVHAAALSNVVKQRAAFNPLHLRASVRRRNVKPSWCQRRRAGRPGCSGSAWSRERKRCGSAG